MKENTDYELIPVDDGNEQSWDIRILKGDYVETVLRYGNVSYNGIEEVLNFNFIVVSSPDPDVSTDSVPVQEVAGAILENIIEESIKKEEVAFTEREA